MEPSKAIQLIGLIIAIPLLIFAVKSNLWAEPLPPEKQIPFTVVRYKEVTIGYAEEQFLSSDRRLGESEN